MASTARDMAPGLLSPEYLGPVLALAAGGRGVASAQTARALTSAGLAALILFPMLLLASLVLEAPIAVPAAIALGYLAIAHAVTFGRPRRAAALSAAVLTGFVAWTLLAFLAGEGPLSLGGLIAVSLSPLFAAAPALARRIAMPRPDPAAARAEIVCLDRLAPSEAVILLDECGSVLGGTKAGFAALGLCPAATAQDVPRTFQLADRAALIQAIERCAAGAQPMPMVLQLEDKRRAVEVELASNGPGRLVMRIREVTAGESIVEPFAGMIAGEAVEQARPEALSCDLGEAIAFAIRHAEPKARARRIRIACGGAAGIAAAVDRRTCRVIINALLDDATACCPANGEVTITARQTRGAVLARIGFQPDPSDTGPAEQLRGMISHRALPELVDGIGGSLLVEPANPSGIIGVRLALPALPALRARQ